MTITPDTPTTPAASPDHTAPGPDPAAVDQTLAARVITSADMLTGLLTAGLLDHAGQPQQLPTLLWPDADPALVQAIWDAGAAAGYYAGKRAGAPRWEPETLDAHRQALADAGYALLAGHVATTATHGRRPHPPAHPADADHAEARGHHS